MPCTCSNHDISFIFVYNSSSLPLVWLLATAEMLAPLMLVLYAVCITKMTRRPN